MILAGAASSFIHATPEVTKQHAFIGSTSTLARSTLLSDPEKRSSASWNEAGTRLLIASVPLDRTAQGGRRDQIGTMLTLIDPLKTDERRVIAELPGTGWFDFTFSPDDKWLAMIRYVSRTETEVWRMNVASGKRERLLPATESAARATYFGLAFSPDGSRLYLTTTARSEFQQIAEYRFNTRALRYFSSDIAWDVKSMALSHDGRRLAAVFNVDGRDELQLFDPASGKALARPKVPGGQISGLKWHEKRVSELAFTLNSPQSPGTIFSVDTTTGIAQRWTTADTAGVDPASFRDAEIVRWKSFDGRMISGVLTLPPPRFTGPRPVIVAIHGGPEVQATVNFNARFNYLINELGIALLEPNVRGSSGYGKTFLDLDNGVKREDSVKDIGALLDWIATDSRLDANRVMVQGGSYGGYMVLASLVHYSDRLRGGIDVVGISDFVSFLGNTESYRRDLQACRIRRRARSRGARRARSDLTARQRRQDSRTAAGCARQERSTCASQRGQADRAKSARQRNSSLVSGSRQRRARLRAQGERRLLFLFDGRVHRALSAGQLTGRLGQRPIAEVPASRSLRRALVRSTAFKNDLTASRLPRPAGRRRTVVCSSSAWRGSVAHRDADEGLVRPTRAFKVFGIERSLPCCARQRE